MEPKSWSKDQLRERLKESQRKDWSKYYEKLAAEENIVFDGPPPEGLMTAIYSRYHGTSIHPHLRTFKDGTTVIYLDAK